MAVSADATCVDRTSSCREREGRAAHAGGCQRFTWSTSSPATRKTSAAWVPKRSVHPSTSFVGSASGSRRTPSCGTWLVRPPSSYQVPCAESRSWTKVADDELTMHACARDTEESPTTMSACAPLRPTIKVRPPLSDIVRAIRPFSKASSRGLCITGSLAQSGGRHRRCAGGAAGGASSGAAGGTAGGSAGGAASSC